MARLLGRLPKREDPRTLQLATYLDLTRLPSVPDLLDWGANVPEWGMLGNDKVGDCTCAAACHAEQLWTRDASGTEALITDEDALDAYKAITGYDPNDPSTDRGAVELDVLRYWRSNGIAGRKIGAFAEVRRRPGGMNDALWLTHIRVTIALFGVAYIGLDMPLCFETQHVWSVPRTGTSGRGRPGSWGGHAIILDAYDRRDDLFGGITWGERQQITGNALLTYCEEAYAIVSEPWVTGARLSPSGFDMQSLMTDLQLLK